MLPACARAETCTLIRRNCHCEERKLAACATKDMIPRYTLPEMGAVWTEENRFRKWLDVELAVCEVHAEMGTIPASAVEVIKQKANFDVNRINELEKITRHDVIAFTTSVAEFVGPESRFVHYGLTSSDVVDTAN